MSVTIDMSYYVCTRCGILFGIPEMFAKQRHHADILCPNGHSLGNGSDRIGNLRSSVDSAEGHVEALFDENETLKRSLAATKGALTKAKAKVQEMLNAKEGA